MDSSNESCQWIHYQFKSAAIISDTARHGQKSFMVSVPDKPSGPGAELRPGRFHGYQRQWQRSYAQEQRGQQARHKVRRRGCCGRLQWVLRRRRRVQFQHWRCPDAWRNGKWCCWSKGAQSQSRPHRHLLGILGPGGWRQDSWRTR